MSNYARRPARMLAGVLAGALALSVTPILGFSAAGALEPATGDGSVCEDVTPATEPFTDVQSNDVAINEIICLVATGITKGVTPTTYEPTSPVTRRQMALFLVRLADEIEEHAVAGQVTPLPAGDGVTPFTDISGESAEAKVAIDRLNEAGIAQGVTATTFVPGDAVTRRQMAKFIVRLQEFMAGADITPDNAPNAFTDDEGDSGEAELNVLAAEGVFIGNAAPNAGTVSPGANISRRQMALVIIRKAQYLFEEGVITRLFDEDDTNQAFGVDATETRLVDSTDPNQDPALTYTFSGLPNGSYEVALFHCGSYEEDTAVKSDGVDYPNRQGVSDGSGIFTFRDQDLDDIADDAGETLQGNAEIATIGFTAINSQHASDITVSNGTLVVRVVDANGGGDCAVPVIWQEAAGPGENDELDLNPDTTNSWNTPSEPFAVGGAAVFHNGEAPSGYAFNDWDVVFLNTADNFWVEWGEGYIMRYGRPGDQYHYDGTDVDGFISEAQFEDLLSPGTYFSGSETSPTYSRAGNTTWSVDPDYPGAVPTNVTAAEGDFDSPTPDGTADDLRVTWTAPAPPEANIDQYCVDYALANAISGVWTNLDCTDEVNTLALSDAPTSLTVTNHGLGDGVYQFRVYIVSETDDSGDYSLLSAPVAIGAAGDTTRPGITDARVTTDAGLQDRFDNGDVVTMTFNEDMDASTAASGTFVLTDADGDTFELSCGGTAACVLGDGGTPATPDDTLVLTVNATIADTNVPGDGLLEMPATITTTNAAVADEAGNVVNLANPPSTDVIVDKEP